MTDREFDLKIWDGGWHPQMILDKMSPWLLSDFQQLGIKIIDGQKQVTFYRDFSASTGKVYGPENQLENYLKDRLERCKWCGPCVEKSVDLKGRLDHFFFYTINES